MLEILFELLGEIVIQFFGELMIELFLRRLTDPLRDTFNPWLSGLGYVALGVVTGALSLWVIPASMIEGDMAKVINLALTPVVVGFAMTLLGRWRGKRGQRVLRIDRFACGYAFALAFAAVRFIFAT